MSWPWRCFPRSPIGFRPFGSFGSFGPLEPFGSFSCAPFSVVRSHGDRQGPHFARAGSFEHRGARLQCRTCRPHVVNECDDAATHRSSCQRGHHEGAAQVSPPGRRRESGLRSRGADTPQHANDRRAKAASQVIGLIESPPDTAPGMEGYRHNRVHTGQDVRTRRPHHVRKRRGQPTPAVVLERMNDLPESTLIEPGCACRVNQAGRPAAARASIEGRADHPPGGQRLATGPTERSAKYWDADPTGIAHWTGKR
jgi:hypothetical protein